MAPDEIQTQSTRNSRRSFLINSGALITTGVLLGGVVACQAGTQASGEMVVYKTPTCGGCTAWVNHLKDAGFNTRVVNQNDLTNIRKQFGAPNDLASCHIAQIDGYIVEGHIPADAIKKLIAEKRAEFEESAKQRDAFAKSEYPAGAQLCSKCSTVALIMMDGCMTCLS